MRKGWRAGVGAHRDLGAVGGVPPRNSARVVLRLCPPCPQKLAALLQEAVGELELAKGLVLKRLHIWKRQQQLAGNGAPFDESLAPLQERWDSRGG